MASIYLRPNSTISQGMYWIGGYTNIDEADPANDSDYCQCTIGSYAYFGLEDTSETGIISKVTLFYRCWKAGDTIKSATAAVGCRIGSTYYGATFVNLTITPTLYSAEYSLDPSTSAIWTFSGINSLVYQMSLSGYWAFGEDLTYARCSQAYIRVDYTPGAGATYYLRNRMKTKQIP